MLRCLAAETIQCTALTLKCVDNVQGGDSLALGVFGVCDGVANNTFEEGLQNTSGLFVDHWDMSVCGSWEGTGERTG